jgi:hypothetical protein
MHRKTAHFKNNLGSVLKTTNPEFKKIIESDFHRNPIANIARDKVDFLNVPTSDT